MNLNDSMRHQEKMPEADFPVHIFYSSNRTGPGLFFHQQHWHEYIQFMYFTKGEAVIYCNAKPIQVGLNELIVINSNELHYGKNLHYDLEFYCLKIDFTFLLSNYTDSCQTKYIAPLVQQLILFKNKISSDPQILGCFRQIIDEYFKREPGFELAIKGYIFNLLALLFRGFVEKTFTEKEYLTKVMSFKRFHPILEFIENHFTEDICLTQLAKLANLSPAHFCRIFKKITGESVTGYIHELRISKAYSLLIESDQNISEIALECGFNDINYFSRLFKKYKLIAPSQVRRARN